MRVRIHTERRPASEQCIYCGATSGLEDEHVVPFGLWGRLVFPDASCRSCAETINVFETQVLQKHLGPFRARTKVPLRKRRRRNYKYTLVHASVDGRPPPAPPIEIGAEELPRQFIMPRFMPPEALYGRWPQPVGYWFYQNPKDNLALMERYGNTAHFAGEYRADMFCRMLAKIGHAFALAYLEPAIQRTFEFLLPDIILRGITDHSLVGGNWDLSPATDMMHELAIFNAVNDEMEYLAATIRLFSCLGAPTYHAVVARRPRVSKTVTEDPVPLPTLGRKLDRSPSPGPEAQSK